jgi:hypothetical protein
VWTLETYSLFIHIVEVRNILLAHMIHPIHTKVTVGRCDNLKYFEHIPTNQHISNFEVRRFEKIIETIPVPRADTVHITADFGKPVKNS